MNKKMMALALAAVLSAPALAGDFYAGADVGRTRINADGVTATATGGSLYGGYQLNSNVAFEAGYRGLGSSTETISGVRVKIEGSAWQASALFSAPLSNEFSVFGRLGVNRVEAKASSAGVSAKEHDTKGLFGFGARYAVSKEIGLRAEFQKPDSDVKVFSIGADYRF